MPGQPYAMNGAEPDQNPHRGLSTAAKLGIGCGITAILGICVCGGLVYYGYSMLMTEMGKVTQKYERQGYVRVTQQVVDEREPVTERKVYVAQVVRLHGGAETDVAMVCQVAEIDGTVNGNIGFFGQVLLIKPGAVVKGDLTIDAAQLVNIQGTVEGEVKGTYQTIQRSDAPGTDQGGVRQQEDAGTRNSEAGEDTPEPARVE